MSIRDVLMPQIAVQLQQLCAIETVGGLLRAWRDPQLHDLVEQSFDTPDQARQAIELCAGWVGRSVPWAHAGMKQWWPTDGGRFAAPPDVPSGPELSSGHDD